MGERAAASASTLPSLSPREYEVLGLLAEGLTNAAIGRETNLAEKTVETIVGNVFARIGLVERPDRNRRVLAARLFLEAGHTASPWRRPNLLVGRDNELATLEALIELHPLVTIIGLGGMGKTAVALEFAARRRALQPVVLVDLIGADALAARDRLHEAFGLGAATNLTARRMIARRLAKDPALILIDNAEDVRATVASLAAELVAYPGVRVVVTSRRSLGVAGERVVRLGPLDAAASVELVRACYAEAGTIHTLDDDSSAALTSTIGGMPLALQLAARNLAAIPTPPPRAAAITSLMPPEGTGRHRSVSAVLDQTYGELSASGRQLLDAAAHFPAPFTVDAARSCLGHIADAAVFGALREVVASSLVDFDGQRYRLVEAVRQDLLARPRSEGGVEALIHWVVGFTSALDRGMVDDPATWRARYDADAANVDAAVAAALHVGHTAAALHVVRRAARVWRSAASGSRLRRVENVLSRLDGTEADVDVGWAMLTAGQLAANARDAEVRDRWRAEALARFLRADDEAGAAHARYAHSRSAGDHAGLQRAADDAHRLGLDELEGWARLTMARDHVRGGGNVTAAIEQLDCVDSLAAAGGGAQLAANAVLLRAEVFLQSNWLGQTSVPVTEIDAMLDRVERFTRRAGGAMEHNDLLSIVTQAHLHHGRWAAAAESVVEQLGWAPQVEDPVLVSEAIVMAAVVLHHHGLTEQATSCALNGGRTLRKWAGPTWAEFTVHPSPLAETVERSLALPRLGVDAMVELAADTIAAVKSASAPM